MRESWDMKNSKPRWTSSSTRLRLRNLKHEVGLLNVYVAECIHAWVVEMVPQLPSDGNFATTWKWEGGMRETWVPWENHETWRIQNQDELLLQLASVSPRRRAKLDCSLEYTLKSVCIKRSRRDLIWVRDCQHMWVCALWSLAKRVHALNGQSWPLLELSGNLQVPGYVIADTLLSEDSNRNLLPFTVNTCVLFVWMCVFEYRQLLRDSDERNFGILSLREFMISAGNQLYAVNDCTYTICECQLNVMWTWGFSNLATKSIHRQ